MFLDELLFDLSWKPILSQKCLSPPPSLVLNCLYHAPLNLTQFLTRWAVQKRRKSSISLGNSGKSQQHPDLAAATPPFYYLHHSKGLGPSAAYRVFLKELCVTGTWNGAVGRPNYCWGSRNVSGENEAIMLWGKEEIITEHIKNPGCTHEHNLPKFISSVKCVCIS